MVGVQADPAAALQLRDIGPPAENVKAAAKFRQFWGDKAELRRFQVCPKQSFVQLMLLCACISMHLVLQRSSRAEMLPGMLKACFHGPMYLCASINI